MASPQKGNGYTPVAHEILDNICRCNLNGSQYRIIIKIWRMTYGFNRISHEFSITFLQQATGLSIPTTKKELAFLIEKKVLTVVKEATNKVAREIKFNKDYEQWDIPKWGEKMQSEFDLEDLEVLNTIPLEVTNPIPQSNEIPYLEVLNSYPKKEKELKDLKKSIKENVDVFFDRFYEAYPRKISKAAAKKAWIKLAKVNTFDPHRIIANTLNYAETCKLLKTETKFIPHPSTYLNQERYADYPFIDPEGLSTSIHKGNGNYSKDDKNKSVLQKAMEDALNGQGGNDQIFISDGGGLS